MVWKVAWLLWALANPGAEQSMLCQPWLILGFFSNHVWLSQVLPENRTSVVAC